MITLIGILLTLIFYYLIFLVIFNFITLNDPKFNYKMNWNYFIPVIGLGLFIFDYLQNKQ